MLKNKIPLADIVIVILIIALPFLFYSYRYFPDTQIWNGDYFTIDSGLFVDVELYVWNINIKVYIILLLSIWLISCKHWWRYAILIPLIIECFKFSEVLNVYGTNYDEIEFINSLPLTIPIIILVFFLSKIIGNYSLTQDINMELIDEIDELFIELNLLEENRIDDFSVEFTQLRKNRLSFDNMDYIKKLFSLRKQLLNV